jgi:hypothetical protein
VSKRKLIFNAVVLVVALSLAVSTLGQQPQAPAIIQTIAAPAEVQAAPEWTKGGSIDCKKAFAYMVNEGQTLSWTGKVTKVVDGVTTEVASAGGLAQPYSTMSISWTVDPANFIGHLTAHVEVYGKNGAVLDSITVQGDLTCHPTPTTTPPPVTLTPIPTGTSTPTPPVVATNTPTATTPPVVATTPPVVATTPPVVVTTPPVIATTKAATTVAPTTITPTKMTTTPTDTPTTVTPTKSPTPIITPYTIPLRIKCPEGWWWNFIVSGQYPDMAGITGHIILPDGRAIPFTAGDQGQFDVSVGTDPSDTAEAARIYSYRGGVVRVEFDGSSVGGSATVPMDVFDSCHTVVTPAPTPVIEGNASVSDGHPGYAGTYRGILMVGNNPAYELYDAVIDPLTGKLLLPNGSHGMRAAAVFNGQVRAHAEWVDGITILNAGEDVKFFPVEGGEVDYVTGAYTDVGYTSTLSTTPNNGFFQDLGSCLSEFSKAIPEWLGIRKYILILKAVIS